MWNLTSLLFKGDSQDTLPQMTQGSFEGPVCNKVVNKKIRLKTWNIGVYK